MSRRKKTENKEWQKPLKSTAIPSLMNGKNLPKYLSRPTAPPRAETATTSSRLQKQNARLEDTIAQYFARDCIKSFSHLKESLKILNIPSDITVTELLG